MGRFFNIGVLSLYRGVSLPSLAPRNGISLRKVEPYYFLILQGIAQRCEPELMQIPEF
jgi:hypothetical protein